LRAAFAAPRARAAAPRAAAAVPVEEFDVRVHMAAGAVGRATAIFAMYPLDTLKTRAQMRGVAGLAGVGVRDLFRGVGGSLAGQVPFGAIAFASYEVLKRFLEEKTAFGLVQRAFLAAILADMTGAIWLVPSELVKHQVQARVYPTAWRALRAAVRSGGVAGLYRGGLGQVARDVPFRAIQMPAFEVAKRLYLRRARRSEGDAPARLLKPLESLIVGGAAGTFAAALTTPMDVVKTRLMTAAAREPLGAVVASLWREEGAKGFFRGVGARVAYVGPSCSLFFVAYESTKRFATKRAAQRAARN